MRIGGHHWWEVTAGPVLDIDRHEILPTGPIIIYHVVAVHGRHSFLSTLTPNNCIACLSGSSSAPIGCFVFVVKTDEVFTWYGAVHLGLLPPLRNTAHDDDDKEGGGERMRGMRRRGWRGGSHHHHH